MAYLLDDNFYNKTEINLKFSNFKTREYPQHYNKNSYFDKLSVIDVIANLGWSGAKDYIIDNS
jgi:hypothetical protein